MTPDAETEEAITRLLEHLRIERGFDVTGYKRPSLLRRIERRMSAVGVDTIDGYRDYLEVHPDEFPLLFDSILIKVTEFFRDPDAWSTLRELVIPTIVARSTPERPLRVWCAGCASGEEAYTIAMVLAEQMKDGASPVDRIKIYATDIDEEVLAKARSGVFSERQLRNVDPMLRERYFELTGGSYVFRPDLRRMIIFGRHDLTSDAPISRLDLLSCRNTLMYFNAELQAKVIDRFHYALNDDGYLFLGKAETLLAHDELFQPVDTRDRIFAKAQVQVSRYLDLAQEMLAGQGVKVGDSPVLSRAAAVSPVAQLVVDLDGFLVGANSVARAQFGVTPPDIGRPFHDLPVSYRPLELRSIIESAYADGVPRTRKKVERVLDDGGRRAFDVTVTPLIDDAGTPLGVSVVFVDVTEAVRLREEMTSSQEHLQTATEELQSANEELETTNEELQSANEELETTNEELQSANEELATMNDDLQRRTLELDRSSGLLDSVVASISAGVVVVNPELRVEIWNAAAEELFGITAAGSVGEAFPALDLGLPPSDLVSALGSAVAGARSEIMVDRVETGRTSVRYRFRVSPLLADRRSLRGAVIVVTTEALP